MKRAHPLHALISITAADHDTPSCSSVGKFVFRHARHCKTAILGKAISLYKSPSPNLVDHKFLYKIYKILTKVLLLFFGPCYQYNKPHLIPTAVEHNRVETFRSCKIVKSRYVISQTSQWVYHQNTAHY